MKRPTLLALDLAIHCGWALFTDAGVRVASGVWTLVDRPGCSRTELLRQLVRARVAAGVRRVAYEHIRRHAGTTAAHVFGGWLTQLREVAAQTGVKLIALRTQDLHAAAGVELLSRAVVPDKNRRRTLNKLRMVAAARLRGWPVVDDNEAEACFCAAAALTT